MTKKKNPEDKKKAGRKLSYTPELGKQICDLISNGHTTLAVSKMEGMPSLQTIYTWRNNIPEFLEMYVRAREFLCQHWADEIIDVSDDSSRDFQEVEESRTTKKGSTITLKGVKSDNTAVNRDRLRVDSRKWLLSKLKPGEYGDKTQHEHSGDVKCIFEVTFGDEVESNNTDNSSDEDSQKSS